MRYIKKQEEAKSTIGKVSQFRKHLLKDFKHS